MKDSKSYVFDAEPTVWSPKVFLPDECKNISGLREYVDELRARLEKGRTDINAAVEVMRSLSKEKIEKDLERIVRTSGKEW